MRMLLRREDWQVPALSFAGLFFILIGLGALALPATSEGIAIWQLSNTHTLNLMDGLGLFVVCLGVMLTWLSGIMWQNLVRH